ncbi:MAG: hypothetical protein EXX96DRAFT_562995 [Benjaminiella poitrasii]|nr:MAG: hypothetical protein EXX96DRAFT_562995 [Benjaminiella poitrasii]
MTDTNVEHRFVQVYQACETAGTSSTDSAFWMTLKDASTIATSHICESLVHRSSSVFPQLIQCLQNLILTTDDPSPKVHLFLHTLTRLILSSSHPNFTPLVVLLREKPSLYFFILEEIEYIVRRDEPIDGLKEVFKAILAAPELSSSALLNRLMIVRSTFVGPIMSDILFDYPLHKEDASYFELVDFLMTTTAGTKWPELLLYPLLDRLLTILDDDRSSQCPLTAYLTRLIRLLDESEEESSIDLVWTALSYLLLQVETVQSQQALVGLMSSVAKRVDRTVLCVASLPLYQVLSELNDKHIHQNLKALKQQVLDMIGSLDYLHHKTVQHSQKSKQLKNIVKQYNITGLLSHMSVYLHDLYCHQPPSTSTNPTLCALFTTPLLDDAPAAYTRLTHYINTLSKYKFPYLLLLLHRLRSSEGALTIHLFRDTIPSLAHPHDTTMTSKILQLILTTQQRQETMMTVLGLKALHHLFRIHPRVWQELKRVLTDWVAHRKSTTPHRRDLSHASTQRAIKLELAMLTTMRDVCRDQPSICAADMLPLAVSILQTCRDLSECTLTLLLATIRHCVVAGVAEARSIWTVCVQYMAHIQTPLVVRELCRFYRLVGGLRDNSEPFLQFKSVVLTDHVVPLLDLNDMTRHAVAALAAFPPQDIVTVLSDKAPEAVREISQCPDSQAVLSKLISHELDHMRRTLFQQQPQQPQVQQGTGHDVEQRLLDVWQSGHVPPGLRSGYTIASLHLVKDPKWHRLMTTAFTDITLTDHLLLRLSSVASWQSFFRRNLTDAKEEGSTVLKDLMARLDRSSIPGVACNMILAITGLVLVMGSDKNEVVQYLLKTFVEPSPTSRSSVHLMSEEVQFAARFALAHLASEADVAVMERVWTKSTTRPARNLDTAVDLVQFANGFVAGRLKVDEVALDDDSRAMGYLMGLSTIKDESKLGFARDQLERYLRGEVVQKGLVFGSTWLCAAHQETALLEAVMSAAVAQGASLAQHFYHFLVPYLMTLKDERPDLVASLVKSIETDDAAGHYRLASFFGLAALVGVRYIDTVARPIESTTRQIVLEVLSDTIFKNKTVGKAGRVAAALLGKVLEHRGPSSSSSTTSTTVAAHDEPSNYSRLGRNTSYLRAVFDLLGGQSSCEVLWEALADTRGPLPAVDWRSRLVDSEACLRFVSVHAVTSTSLFEALVSRAQEDEREIVLGRVLSIAGLSQRNEEEQQQTQRRGMKAVSKRVQVSESRVLEWIVMWVDRFKGLEKEKQAGLLDTLSRHLVSEDEEKKGLIASIQDVIYQGITVSLLATDNALSHDLLRKAVRCTPHHVLDNASRQTTTTLTNRVVALCECYRVVKQEEQQKVVKQMVSVMIELMRAEDETSWCVLAHDLIEPTTVVSWLLRYLDVFIVYLSSEHARESHRFVVGLHAIVSSSQMESEQEIELTDTVYLFQHYVRHASPTEQEQIIKRIYRISEMSVSNQDVIHQIILTLPRS